MAVVVPFRGIAIDWPALAELGDAVAIEDIALGAVDVAPDGGLGFLFGDIVNHFFVDQLGNEHSSTMPAHPAVVYKSWLPLPNPGSLDMTSSPTVVEAGCQS